MKDKMKLFKNAFCISLVIFSVFALIVGLIITSAVNF